MVSRGGVQAEGQGRGLEGRLREKEPGCVGNITREVWKADVQGSRAVDMRWLDEEALGFRGA